MSEAETFFYEIGKEFPLLRQSKMFGAPCYKTKSGKSAAMLWKDGLVVKLKDDKSQEILKLPDTMPFEPMEGRKMKEWVLVPFSHKKRWKELITLSSEYVTRLKDKGLPQNKETNHS